MDKTVVRKLSWALPVVWISATFLILAALVRYVDLKPRVEENFFFATDDPQFREDKTISRLFPEPPQLILSAKGELRSTVYIEKMKRLTQALSALPEVFSVQSITKGPHNLDDAFESPLWQRILISDDGQSTMVSVFVEEDSAEAMVPKVEEIIREFSASDFQLMISGAPYIVELIRRNLAEDFKIFTAAAFIIFGILVLFVFHSVPLLAGTLIACVDASAATLIVNELLKIKIGVLTANLSTIVFVMTLSHIVFLTFNWRLLAKSGQSQADSLIPKALRLTLQGSFWSMLTTLLGFISLFSVKAAPLRQLGVSGAIGTLIAFLAAYAIYPSFLTLVSTKPKTGEDPIVKIARPNAIHSFLRKRQGRWVAGIGIFAVVAILGIRGINMDPSLLSFFREGGGLREGLEYIDRNGGSNPLKIVVKDAAGEKFNKGEVYERVWKLHEALEADPAVGVAVSLPIIMAEGKRAPFAFILPWEWLLKIMESAPFDRVAKYFVSEDRTLGFFMLRMNERGREGSRLENVERIREIVRQHNFVPELMGGVYLLQGQLSKLITSSMISGIVMLVGMFVIMALWIARSFRVAFSMFVSLSFIPLVMLGVLGHFHTIFDIISSPAANIAIGMGVDAMMHTLIRARLLEKNGFKGWEAWSEARIQLYAPILYAMLIVAAGFAIFGLSQFPPTQRFGFSVVLGTLLSPIAALFLFPYLSSPAPEPAAETDENLLKKFGRLPKK